MARIPDVYESRAPLNVGGSVNVPDRVSPGAGIEALGQGIRAVGGALEEIDQRDRDSADDAWFSRARAGAAADWLKTETDLKLGATGPATGFADNAAKAFTTFRDSIAKSAPSPRAKQAFIAWSELYGSEARQRAFLFEKNALLTERGNNLNAAFGSHVQAVYADPAQYETVLARAFDDLEGAKAWMTPEDEAKARLKIETDLQLARAKKLAKYAPLQFLAEVGMGAGVVGTTAAKIIGAESGGDPDAKNPRSSATGPGQFTEDTWLDLIARYRPDIAREGERGRATRSEILALRSDPILSRDLTERYTEENARTLSSAGLPVTEGSLYLAHFAGPGGAAAVLAAGDDTLLDKVLSPHALKANPFLAGKTVAWLRQWADAKMGSTTPAFGKFADDPRYAGLTVEQIESLVYDARQAVVSQHKEATNQKEAIYAERFNVLLVGIRDGIVRLNDITDARNDGWLTDADDIAKATNAIVERDKDVIGRVRAVSRAADPGEFFNPFNNDDRKDLDLAFQEAGGADGLFTTADPQAVARLRRFVVRGDIVPFTAVTSLQAGIRDRNAAVMGRAFSVLDGLYRENPGAVTRSFTPEDVKRLLDYQQLAPFTPPDELAARLDPYADPKRTALRDQLLAEGRTLAGKIETAEIQNVFDPVLLAWQAPHVSLVGAPSLPIDPISTRAMRNDFETLFAERYAVGRDPDKAKAQALELLKGRWGPTEIGSGRFLMAYPPEHKFPAIDGDHDWMDDQIAAIVDKEYPGAASYAPVMMDFTEGVAAANGALGYPSYAIGVVDADGALRVMLPPPGANAGWPFDPDAARAARIERFRKEREGSTEPGFVMVPGYGEVIDR